jgi:hypothetical protein
MKSWKTPTPNQVDRAVALMGHAEHYRYFFSELVNPNWIEPLKEKAFFTKPPEPRRDEVGNVVAFPPWPESHYLARMASLRPEAVLSVILEMPDTDNVRVHEDLVDAALNMPADLAAQISKKARAWLGAPDQVLLPEELGALVAHLAKGGKSQEALSLARTLLEVLPDPSSHANREGEGPYRLSPQPRIRLDKLTYERVIKRDFPAVLRSAGIAGFDLLCDLLESAACLSLAHEADGQDDFSYVWRPAVEDHPQNFRNDLKGILVAGVREAAEQLIRDGIADIRGILDALEKHRWLIFQRLSLHILRVFPGAATDVVAARLADRTLFDDGRIRHEYQLLLADRFESLTEDQKATVLDWIKSGPAVDKYRQRHRQETGTEPNPGELEEYRGTWQRDRLAWLKVHLPNEWREAYERLVAEYGEPESQQFPVGWSGLFAPLSPKSPDELRTISVESLVEFLRRWNPPHDPLGPSREGLVREMQKAITADPQRFSREATRFKDLDAPYEWAIIAGLRDAAEQGSDVEWSPVLDLCEWAVHQRGGELAPKAEFLDEQPDWAWIRRATADLLAAGLKKVATGIPSQHREKVWEVLVPLTGDPDPTPKQERTSLWPNTDPASLTINTVRGTAMHTVIRYALWVHRNSGEPQSAGVRTECSFDIMPEVRDVLDLHLDPAKEPSLAIRSVYGQWFPWLVMLDAIWARAQVPKIFPLGDAERDLYDAAWEAYIIFCRPFDNVLGILSRQYASAVDELGTRVKRGWFADPDARLAEHLMTFYWRGKLVAEDPKGVLAGFWERASDTLRAHAIEFVGETLTNTKDVVPSTILKLLEDLWQMRLAVAQQTPDGHRAEMAAFGWWFASDKFDYQWAIKQLTETLAVAERIEPDDLVVKQLAAHAEAMANESVKCLDAIVRGDRDGWGIYGWTEPARKILARALRERDTEAAKRAEALIHYLGRRGYPGFRDLL